MNAITDLDALRAHFGPTSELVRRKALPRLDRHARAFIALSPFLVLATADGEGGVDASPRGDAPGFVMVLDDTTLLLPDRPGNRRVDSFSNVVKHPGIGTIFIVPGIDETLRVNGTARIITDQDLLAPTVAQGKVPATGLLIAVTEMFFHCGKAMMRSKLWDASRHVPRKDFPSLGRIVAEQTQLMTADAADDSIATSYRDRLY
jgi:PPOX class probable FMN-dependent enzyme